MSWVRTEPDFWNVHVEVRSGMIAERRVGARPLDALFGPGQVISVVSLLKYLLKVCTLLMSLLYVVR